MYTSESRDEESGVSSSSPHAGVANSAALTSATRAPRAIEPTCTTDQVSTIGRVSIPSGQPVTVVAVDVHVVDGTYELFRQHFGRPQPGPYGATIGVLGSTLALFEDGATHVGVASDHIIESFRNDLWPGYKTSAGMPPELLAQIPVMEDALAAMGVTVWAMVEYEADDAMGAAAALAAKDSRVTRVFLCTPDKDLGQCVVGTRIVQLDRRKGIVVDEDGVREKFGVGPASIPDYLALVGDSADGFPGLPGFGAKTASAILARYPAPRGHPACRCEVGDPRTAPRPPPRRDARREPRARIPLPPHRHHRVRCRGRRRRRMVVARSHGSLRRHLREARQQEPRRPRGARRQGPLTATQPI